MVLVEADESVNQLFFGVVCDTELWYIAYVDPDSMWIVFSGVSARLPMP